MKSRRHLIAVAVAVAASAFLAACGGGGTATSDGDNGPAALFDDRAVSSLRKLTASGPPPEARSEAEAERRAGQMELAGSVWFDGRPTGTAEDFSDFWFPRRGEIKWKGVLAKKGVSLGDGGRIGKMRSLALATDYGSVSVHTSGPRGDYPGGAIIANGWNIPSGGFPAGSATWRGLMAGADKGSRDLLQGDASITLDFGRTVLIEAFGQLLPFSWDDPGPIIDISVTGIVNLDRMAAHTVATVGFTDIPVLEDGSWVQGCGSVPTCVRGGFGGPGHEDAVAVFETSDMTGGIIARRR